ncbi:MAG: hypothetical protein LAO56_17090 [Acidobacteriia bacterium]|nr:hypothetical protein [Terriglobia bacterium]
MRRNPGRRQARSWLAEVESGEAGIGGATRAVAVEQFPGLFLWGEGPVRGKSREWGLEIRRRLVESFAEVENPLIRKVRE